MARPMPPVRMFRGPFLIEPDTATVISLEDMRERSLFNPPDLDEPSNVLAISGMDLSDGRYTVSVPLLTEQRGVYNVYLLHESNSDGSVLVSIDGTYTLYALADGVLGEFARADVVVAAGVVYDHLRLEIEPLTQ